jgi:hypothetical protein
LPLGEVVVEAHLRLIQKGPEMIPHTPKPLRLPLSVRVAMVHIDERAEPLIDAQNARPMPLRVKSARSRCSTTPAGRDASGACDALTRPPLCPRRRLLHWVFRGSITRLQHTLSTLRSAGHPHATQDSLPTTRQALSDGIPTRRVTPKGFSESNQLITSSFPKLRSARTVYHTGTPNYSGGQLEFVAGATNPASVGSNERLDIGH